MQFERAWRRPPTAQELQGLIDGWVREEIFYREGMALGLDRNDPIVRRRIGQKVEFIVDGMTPASPSNEELQAWLDAHPERYAIESLHSLRQVYFDPDRATAGGFKPTLPMPCDNCKRASLLRATRPSFH